MLESWEEGRSVATYCSDLQCLGNPVTNRVHGAAHPGCELLGPDMVQEDGGAVDILKLSQLPTLWHCARQ